MRHGTIRVLTLGSVLLLPGIGKAVNCPIQDFGAVGDGKTMNTAAIQKAVDACAQGGGGQVTIPAGTFLSGSIFLKSNIEFCVQAGGTLLGSHVQTDYQKLDAQDAHSLGPADLKNPHTAKGPSLALLLAENAQNVTVSGPGTIDGQGQLLAADTERMLQAGAFGAENKHDRPDERHRPQLIDFLGCKNVVVKDVLLKDSSSWVQTYNACDGLQIDHVRVDSTAYWNNDGIDLVDCRNVAVRRCDINAADDAICLKSHNPGAICENIEISDCRLRSSATALKLGTASAGGFRNVTVNNLEIRDTFRSAIALESVDGGVLEHIRIHHVTAVHTGGAIFIRRGLRIRTKPSGAVRDIVIDDLSVHVPGTRPDPGYRMEGPGWTVQDTLLPSSIVGLPGSPVENVTLSNIDIFYDGENRPTPADISTQTISEKPDSYPEFSMFGPLPSWGLYARHASGLTLKNVRFHVQGKDTRPPVVLDDVSGTHSETVTANGSGVGPF